MKEIDFFKERDGRWFISIPELKGGQPSEQSVVHWLHDLHRGNISGVYAELVEKELAGYGLRIIDEKLYIATAAKTGIERIFKGTQWDRGGHLEPLRHLGAESISSSKYFSGVSSKAYTFPIEDIIRYVE